MLIQNCISRKQEMKDSISSDTSLTIIESKSNSFYEDTFELINKLNLNGNIINKKEKDNNITSYIKIIQFRKNDVILLFFIIILPTIQLLSDMKIAYIVSKIRRIEYNNIKSLFSLIWKNIFHNEYSLNDDFEKNIMSKFITYKMYNFYNIVKTKSRIYYTFIENYDIIKPFLSVIEKSNMKKKFKLDFYSILVNYYQKKINGNKLSFFKNSFNEMIIYIVIYKIINIIIIDVLKLKILNAYIEQKALYQENVTKKVINNNKNRFNDIKRELPENSIETMKIKNNYKIRKKFNYKIIKLGKKLIIKKKI